MKLNSKELLSNLLNAAVLPIIVLGTSVFYLQNTSQPHPLFSQIFIFPQLLLLYSVALFALSFKVLNHIRWPFILAAYALGGWVATQAYDSLFAGPILSPSLVAVSALIGVALTTRLSNRFYLFHPKLNLPGSVWVAITILLDAGINLGLKGRLLEGNVVNWQANGVAIASGITLGLVAKTLFSILTALSRNTASNSFFAQVACRETPCLAMSVESTTTPLPSVSAPTAAPTPANPIKQPTPPRSKSTNKLLSRTDLPQIKTPAGSASPTKKQHTPSVETPSETQENWLNKHLSALNN